MVQSDYTPSMVYNFDVRSWVPVQSEAYKVNFNPNTFFGRRLTITRIKYRGVWRTVHMARYWESGPSHWIIMNGQRMQVYLRNQIG